MTNFKNINDFLDADYEWQREPIVKGIFYRQDMWEHAGPKATFKSMFTNQLALCLAAGHDFLRFEVERAFRVSLLQWENKESQVQDRLRAMMRGQNIKEIPDENLVILDRRTRVDLPGERGKLEDLVKESGAEVIIFDCLSNMHNEKENAPVAMRHVMDAFATINLNLRTSCFIVHHFSQPTNENRGANLYRVRGSTTITDAPDIVSTATRTKDGVKLVFEECRNGKRPEPVNLIFDEESLLLRLPGEKKTSKTLEVGAILREIGEPIEGRKNLEKAIMEKVDCSDRTAANRIRDAVKEGEICEIDQGKGRPKIYVAG